MAIVEEIAKDADGRRRLGLKSPATLEPVGEITVSNAQDVAAAVARARAAQPAWAARSPEERAAIVGRVVELLLERKDSIADTLVAESGKTRVEAMAMEIFPCLDYVNHWSARAPKQLADHKRKLHGVFRIIKKLHIHYRPLGVVGIITPWNGPLALSINPTVQALLAGNAVLLKPSEVTPRSGGLAVELLQAAGVPADVVQVLHGDGETGAALVNAGVDKISFTGSVATGRKVAVACAEQLIPCTAELGGKDAMIVCADANLERAAAGAVFAGMMNTGQVCIGVERIYVVESVADAFIEKVGEIARSLRLGSPGEDADIGSLFWERQMEIVSSHVAAARESGARIVAGGERDASRKGLFFQPTVVTDVNHDMTIMRDETFGPVIAIQRVADEDEAVRMANDSPYGLSGSVWTNDDEKAIRIATRLETGSVTVNDASIIYGVCEAPFGGLKESGVGRTNGPDAIRAWCHEQPILLDRFKRPKEDLWYPFGEKSYKALDQGFKLYKGFMRRLAS